MKVEPRHRSHLKSLTNFIVIIHIDNDPSKLVTGEPFYDLLLKGPTPSAPHGRELDEKWSSSVLERLRELISVVDCFEGQSVLLLLHPNDTLKHSSVKACQLNRISAHSF